MVGLAITLAGLAGGVIGYLAGKDTSNSNSNTKSIQQ